MPSGKRNLITVKGMGLIFFTVRGRFIPRCAFWHTTVQWILTNPNSSVLKLTKVCSD